MKKLSLLFFSGLLSVIGAQAQTWTGATSSDWNTASNWNPATVPTATSSVSVNNGTPPNWPVLSNNITVGQLSLAGQIDTKGYSITTNYSGAGIVGIGAIVKNTNAGTPIVFNFYGTSKINMGSVKFMDSVIFNVNGSMDFYEGYYGIDTLNSNATFNFNGTGQCMVGSNSACVYKGDLTVNRTSAGETDIFPSAISAVGGNFSYTNLVGGTSNIGNTGGATAPNVISGQMNANIINPINAGNPQVYIDDIKNLTTGGTVNIKYPENINIAYDTLSITSMNISGISSSVVNNIWDCTLNGNLNFADSITNTEQFLLHDNVINGNSVFTINSNQIFYEGYFGQDTFNGNTTFNFNGTGKCTIADNGASVFNGNLTVNRTVAGETDIFPPSSPSTVSGNFNYTNLVGGTSNIGSIGGTGNPSVISGQMNANIINPINAGNPQVYIDDIKNLTTGGTINIKYPGIISMGYDTLKVTSLNISGVSSSVLYGIGWCTLNGNLNFADSSNSPSQFNFGSNVVNGNSVFTINSNQTFYEGGEPGADIFNGNANFNFNGTGKCIVGNNSRCVYNGNLTVNRTVAGETDIFQSSSPSTVSGNFSYTNLVGGTSNIGSIGGTNNPSVISGQMNANIINPINAGNPQVYIDEIKNLTTGGTINIKYPGITSMGYDTLNVTSLNISGISSGNASGIGYNTLNGNLNIADSSTNSNFFNFGSNVVNGNSVFTLNSNQPFYEACCGGDIFNGNVTYNVTNAGTIYLGRNGLSQYGGNLSLNGNNFITPGSNPWPMTFIGSGADTLSFTNAALTFPELNMQMSKGGTVMLAKPTVVSGYITFNSGNIISSAANPLTINNGVALNGGNDSSHVIGPVIKYGNQAFTFPLGDSAKYFPASITGPANTTDEFSASFIPHNPTADGYDTASRAPTLQRVTSRGYWDIQRKAGASNVSVTLGYHYSPGAITDPTTLSVAHWNGTLWEDLGNGGVTGNDTVGSVMTATVVSSFSPFTIGSSSALNVLPVTLISFDAAKQGTQTYLNWVVAQETGISVYVVERSSDGNHFISINTINSTNSAIQHAYTIYDNAPLNGTNYYRLKIVDIAGKITYSDIRLVNFGNQNSFIIYPNPAKNEINFQSSAAGVAYIFNIKGELVKIILVQIGVNNLDISNLSSGVYVGQMNGQRIEFLKE